MLGLAGMGVTLSPQIVEASVAKIVAWTSDVRSAEVRKASQDALYSLFSLHPGEVTRILGTLPKVCQVRHTHAHTLINSAFIVTENWNESTKQDSASQIIQSHLNRTMDCVDISGLVDSPTSAGGVSSPLRSTPATPLSQPQTPVSSSQQQPSTPFFSKIRSSKSLENDENEHINPEEVYKCESNLHPPSYKLIQTRYYYFFKIIFIIVVVVDTAGRLGKRQRRFRTTASRNRHWNATRHLRTRAYRRYRTSPSTRTGVKVSGSLHRSRSTCSARLRWEKSLNIRITSQISNELCLWS